MEEGWRLGEAVEHEDAEGWRGDGVGWFGGGGSHDGCSGFGVVDGANYDGKDEELSKIWEVWSPSYGHCFF